MKASQLAAIAEGWANLGKGRKEADQQGAITQAKAARIDGVSVASVKRARKVKAKAIKPFREAVERGKFTLGAASVLADLSENKQERIARRPISEWRAIAARTRSRARAGAAGGRE